jgi:hypothetical protein
MGVDAGCKRVISWGVEGVGQTTEVYCRICAIVSFDESIPTRSAVVVSS